MVTEYSFEKEPRLTRLGVHVPKAHFFPRDRWEEGLISLFSDTVVLSARTRSGLGVRVKWTEDELARVMGRRSGDWFCRDQWVQWRVGEARRRGKKHTGLSDDSASDEDEPGVQQVNQQHAW